MNEPDPFARLVDETESIQNLDMYMYYVMMLHELCSTNAIS